MPMNTAAVWAEEKSGPAAETQTAGQSWLVVDLAGWRCSSPSAAASGLTVRSADFARRWLPRMRTTRRRLPVSQLGRQRQQLGLANGRGGRRRRRGAFPCGGEWMRRLSQRRSGCSATPNDREAEAQTQQILGQLADVKVLEEEAAQSIRRGRPADDGNFQRHDRLQQELTSAGRRKNRSPSRRNNSNAPRTCLKCTSRPAPRNCKKCSAATNSS